MSKSDPSWLVSCLDSRASTNPGDRDRLASILRCFPNRDDDVETPSLPLSLLNSLPSAIIEILSCEIDVEQSSLFSRRFSSVVTLLQNQKDDELLTGLVIRTNEILRTRRSPRALRVRAVADFYYTQAAINHHKDSPHPPSSYAQLIESSPPFTEVYKNSVFHKKVVGLTSLGPINVNVLKIKSNNKEVKLRMVDTKKMASSTTLENIEGAVASVSGGFFLYSEENILPPSHRTDPVGFLMSDGIVSNPPCLKRATLTTTTSSLFNIERIGMIGMKFSFDGVESFTVDGQTIRTYNRANGEEVMRSEGKISIAVVGNSIVEVSCLKETVAIPLAGLVIVMPSECISRFYPPQQIAWEYIDGVDMAMAGGPLLLMDGNIVIDREAEDFALTAPPVTFSQDETFDQNLLPRMGAGLTTEGDLLFVAVDGRNFDIAPGFTLGNLASFMQDLGCVKAMNFDGGSSKRMVVNQTCVDLSSTEVETNAATATTTATTRPVYSAILIEPF